MHHTHQAVDSAKYCVAWNPA